MAIHELSAWKRCGDETTDRYREDFLRDVTNAYYGKSLRPNQGIFRHSIQLSDSVA